MTILWAHSYVSTDPGEPLGDRCKCGHIRFRHPEGRCLANCDCQEYSPPGAEDVPLPEPEEEPPCIWHGDGSRCEDVSTCGRFHAQEQPVKRAELPPPEGPEYTPCGCGHIEPEHDLQALLCYGDRCKCRRYQVELNPPQPERRPPYAVAYSAGGHLYEVLLPGDARAEAVDGRLIIEHPGFQVLGIIRVQPVRTEGE
jgi:hypothetical protein